MKATVSIVVTLVTLGTDSGVTIYEGDAFPEQRGWERVQFLSCDRDLTEGWLVQQCDLGDAQGPLGESDLYRRALADYAAVETFFLEWRAKTDVPHALFDKSGIATVVSAGGTSGTNYHYTLTDAVARFIRDNFLPIVFAAVSDQTPHTYRLELFGDNRYTWYVDGLIVDAGVPEGPYPVADSSLIWGARHNVYENRTAWDYIRYGVIPEDASGDYDSDGAITDSDYYFVHDCLSRDGPGIFGGPNQNAGPGCRFVDFDGNDSVDLFDFAEFQNAFDDPV